MKKLLSIFLLFSLVSLGQVTPTNVWNTTGNTFQTNINWLGTKNNTSLVFKTNNITRLKIDSTGNVNINGVNIQPINAVYFIGNSLTEYGFYPNRIDSLLGPKWTVVNRGISFNTTSQMLSRFEYDITSHKDCGYVVVMGGTNDVTVLTPSTTITANLQSMYTAAHNSGIKVVALTITPRSTNAGQLNIQQQVNSWIKNTAINIDFIVDPYTTLANPINPTELRPSYTTDGLHMTYEGYKVLADYVYSHVTWAPKTIPSGNLSISGDVSIDQDLMKSSNPLFNTVNGLTVGRGGNNILSNTSVGVSSLKLNTTGEFNTSVGFSSLFFNSTGVYNSSFGNFSLYNNTTGSSNNAFGASTLGKNTTGSYNTAIGYGSLGNNTTGSNNIGIGSFALNQSNTGGDNIAIGNNTLQNTKNSLSNLNIAIGSNSLNLKKSGGGNVSIGANSLKNDTSGANNVSIGVNSMLLNKNGSTSVAIGGNALYNNTQSNSNVAIGGNALYNNTQYQNVGIGNNALSSTTSGHNNTAIGYDAGNNALQKIDAVNSTAIGNGAFTTKSNQMVFGNSSVTETVINGLTIHNSNVSLSVAGNGLVIKEGTNARLGTATLTAGTVTISNTSVTANSRIFLQGNGNTNAGFLTPVITAGVGFTVTSSSGTDARTFSYFIVEAQ